MPKQKRQEKPCTVDPEAVEWEWNEALNPDQNPFHIPEMWLWMRVIQFAIFDYIFTKNAASARWLFGGGATHASEGFIFVCQCAGVDPSYLRRKLRECRNDPDLLKDLAKRIFRV